MEDHRHFGWRGTGDRGAAYPHDHQALSSLQYGAGTACRRTRFTWGRNNEK
jgi:hypothetical protein